MGFNYSHKGVGEMVKQVDFGNCHHLLGMLFLCMPGPSMKCMKCMNLMLDSFLDVQPVFACWNVSLFSVLYF